MTANRFLVSAACLPLMVAAAVGQTYSAPPPPASLAPASEAGGKGGGWPAPTSLFPSKSGGLRYAADTQVVPPVVTPPAQPTPTDTLTGTPMPLVPDAVKGAVYSPWCGETPAGGCCGPVGANGPIGYESYLRTGPTLISGGGELTRALKTFGWNVQGGGRTLFFDPPGDAAWVFDLGLGFTNVQGRSVSRPVDVLTNAVKFGGPGGQPTFQAGVLDLRRTSFNFGVGRDHFLNGPGWVGAEDGGNFRFGWDVGGRWGTASVDLEPLLEPGGYRRRHDVYTAVYAAGQATWEKQMGAWTFYIGGRFEWNYYFTNLLPPNDGDFRDVNLLLVTGVRF